METRKRIELPYSAFLGYVERLNELFAMAIQFRLNKDYAGWTECLKSIEEELEAVLGEDASELKEINDSFGKINDVIKEYNPKLHAFYKVEHSTPQHLIEERDNKKYPYLSMISRKLKILAYKLGLLTPRGEE